MRTANRILTRNKGFYIIFFCILFSMLYIMNEPIFKHFTISKRVVLANEKLFYYFLVAETLIGLSYLVIGINLILVYQSFKRFNLPWQGYLWIFAALILIGCSARFAASFNMFFSYYWVEGFIKMLSAIISGTVAVAFAMDSRKIRAMKTPEEYGKLAQAYEELVKQYKEISQQKT